MRTRKTHFEPYVHLAGLTHERALLSWGGFFFRPAESGRDPDRKWRLVDDEELGQVQPGRTECIGERSETYGPARVELFGEDGRRVASAMTSDRNHVWIDGLQPETVYRYEISVQGRPWLAGQRYDWAAGPDGERGLYPSRRTYDCRFTTDPAPETSAPLTFAAFGDYGVGISSDREDSARQLRIAQALGRAADDMQLRLVVTLGDNIYHGPAQGSGDEDDDWFFTFYQPYRYLINRIPFYVTVGNHDDADQENSDDRSQLEDNFYLAQRFGEKLDADSSDLEPGLFYSFRYGADVEFVCIDTTCAKNPYFTRPAARAFLEKTLCADLARRVWRIPFSHHPMYCAGPEHPNTGAMEAVLTPIFKRSGVRLVLAGHEHNFQHAYCEGIHYIVSGAAARLRRDPPRQFEQAHIVDWAARGHFTVVELTGPRAVVRPFTADERGGYAPLMRATPTGECTDAPIVIER